MHAYFYLLLEWYVYVMLSVTFKIMLYGQNNQNGQNRREKCKECSMISFEFCFLITIVSPFLYYFDFRPEHMKR